ncbi:MAG: hypothetical protein U0359_04005 [Byssovorax sp.]
MSPPPPKLRVSRAPRGRRASPALASAALGAALGAILLAAACEDAPALKLCGEIPAGGCPVGRGGTCEDAVCEALYDCQDGHWVSVERCMNEAGAGGAGGEGGAGGGTGGGPCTPVTLDHTGEQLGCMPDLQSPDCPAEAAETCAETACFTGCVDFFLCKKDGWTAIAHCDDQGTLILSP